MSGFFITGNSHLGAVLEASKKMSSATRMEFFGCPGKTFSSVRRLSDTDIGIPENNNLTQPELDIIEQINGKTRASVPQDMALVVVGETFASNAIAFLLFNRAIDSLRDFPGQVRLSYNAFSEFVNDLTTSAVSNVLSGPLGAEADILVMAPRPSEDILNVPAQSGLYKAWQSIAKNPQGARDIFDTYFLSFEQKLASAGIKLVQQPPETLADSGLTKAEFGRSSLRLDSRVHPDLDKMHMNADYGALVLNDIVNIGVAEMDSKLARRHANTQHPVKEDV